LWKSRDRRLTIECSGRDGKVLVTPAATRAR
jgi:hypothetical protein